MIISNIQNLDFDFQKSILFSPVSPALILSYGRSAGSLRAKSEKHSLTKETGGWEENKWRLKATVRQWQEKLTRIKFGRNDRAASTGAILVKWQHANLLTLLYKCLGKTAENSEIPNRPNNKYEFILCKQRKQGASKEADLKEEKLRQSFLSGLNPCKSWRTQ